MAKHEKKPKNKKEQKFICSKCNKIFGTKKHLSQHDPFGITEVQMWNLWNIFGDKYKIKHTWTLFIWKGFRIFATILKKKKFCVSTKTLFVPIDHHAIFKMFKLSFCWSDKTYPKIICFNPFWGIYKYFWLDPKVCADPS